MKRLVQVAILGAALVAGSVTARAADVCIDDKAKTALNACGGVGPKDFDVSKHGKAPQVNFHSAPPPADLKKRNQQTKPNMPTLEAPRDDRKSRLQVC